MNGVVPLLPGTMPLVIRALREHGGRGDFRPSLASRHGFHYEDEGVIRGVLMYDLLGDQPGHQWALTPLGEFFADDDDVARALLRATVHDLATSQVMEHEAWLATTVSPWPWEEYGYFARSRQGARPISGALTIKKIDRTVIRVATPADREQGRFFYNLIDKAQDSTAEPSTFDDEFDDILADETTHYLFLEVDGQVAAQCIVMLTDVTRRDPTVVTLSAVAVAPHFQRRGYGRYLVECALADAHHRGAQLALVNWCTTNAGADAFWSTLGFAARIVATQRNF